MENYTINRRRFLEVAGKTVGLAAAGFGVGSEVLGANNNKQTDLEK